MGQSSLVLKFSSQFKMVQGIINLSTYFSAVFVITRINIGEFPSMADHLLLLSIINVTCWHTGGISAHSGNLSWYVTNNEAVIQHSDTFVNITVRSNKTKGDLYSRESENKPPPQSGLCI